MRRALILTLVLVAAGCAPAMEDPGRATRSSQGSPTPPAAERGRSKPSTPVVVLIGVAIGAALMIALISNSAMMPDTAP